MRWEQRGRKEGGQARWSCEDIALQFECSERAFGSQPESRPKEPPRPSVWDELSNLCTLAVHEPKLVESLNLGTPAGPTDCSERVPKKLMIEGAVESKKL